MRASASKADIDAVAAAIILENYFHASARGRRLPELIPPEKRLLAKQQQQPAVLSPPTLPHRHRQQYGAEQRKGEEPQPDTASAAAVKPAPGGRRLQRSPLGTRRGVLGTASGGRASRWFAEADSELMFPWPLLPKREENGDAL